MAFQMVLARLAHPSRDHLSGQHPDERVRSPTRRVAAVPLAEVPRRAVHPVQGDMRTLMPRPATLRKTNPKPTTYGTSHGLLSAQGPSFFTLQSQEGSAASAPRQRAATYGPQAGDPG